MIIEDVMDDIGNQLDTISGINVLPYEADDIDVPCALVSLPPEINYLATYRRGMDRMTIMVTILVSLVDDRVRRQEIAPFADGAGSQSIKQVLESGTYTAFDVIAVRKGEFDVIDIGGIEYLGAVFTVDIAGPGN